MGKSTLAGALVRQGVPVHDADLSVHRLYAPGGAAVGPIGEAFPGALGQDAGGRPFVDRQRLGQLVMGSPDGWGRLEAIIHPLVRRGTRAWLASMARRGHGLVVLDIPLLYESGGQRLCDAVMTVSAPAFLQRQRALSRPGMSEAKLQAILARQVSDLLRRREADYVIHSGLGKGEAQQALEGVLARERRLTGRVWGPSFGSGGRRR